MKRYWINKGYWLQNFSKIKKIFNFRIMWINFFICLSLFALMIDTNQWLLGIPIAILIFYIACINLKFMWLIWLCLLIWFIFWNIHNYIYLENWYEYKEINGRYTVIDVTEKNVYVQDQYLRKLVVWKSDLYSDITIYSQFYASGKLMPMDYNSNYYASNNIYYIFKVTHYTKLENWWNIRHWFFRYYLQKDIGYYQLIIPLLFGFNIQVQNEIIQSLKDMGAVHLIVVSGLHFATIFGLIKLLTYKFDKTKILCTVLIIIYFFFVKKSISVFRAFAFLLIQQFLMKKHWHHRVSLHQILFWISFIYLLYSPKNVLNLGYWLSFILTFSLILYSQGQAKIEEEKHKNITYLKALYLLKIYFFSWFLSITIITVQQHAFSILSFLYILLLTPVFQLAIIFFAIFFPLTFICSPISYLLSKLIILLHSFNLRVEIPNSNYLQALYILDYFILLKQSLIYKKSETRKYN
ncbi:ComEC/Rec2 family competence protein [Mycoplasma sp. 1458C]|uniref:ComEC/Rec2 family competence protein n=1 Tax=Mycoplasma sp. 1458C TaxID=3401661 RepID=UPI003AACB856